MKPSEFRGLAFGGGGVAEVACGGALQVWIKAGYTLEQFTHFSGTSAGSIVATMLALKASISFIEEKLSTADFSSFVDTSTFDKLRDLYAMWNYYGWNSGDGLNKWVGDRIEELTGNRDITFKEAYDRFGTHLIITKTNLLYPECQLETMDWMSHPNDALREAVTTSCRIPLFFQAASKNNQFFVDGGVLLNYPLRMLYKHLKPEECMGISLRSEPGNLILKPIETYENFITCMVNAWLRATTERHIDADDWKRTCSIHVILSAVDFNADKTRIEEAIKQGEIAMADFLAKLTKPSPEEMVKEMTKLLIERDRELAEKDRLLLEKERELAKKDVEIERMIELRRTEVFGLISSPGKKVTKIQM